MDALWKVWVRTDTREAALDLLGQVLSKIDQDGVKVAVESQAKPGVFLGSFRTGSRGSNWPDAVVETIRLGQRLAYQWLLSGDIDAVAHGRSNKTRVAGLDAVEWTLERPAQPG